MACFRLLRSGYVGTMRKSYAYTVRDRSFIVYYLLLWCVTYTLIVTSYYAYV